MFQLDFLHAKCVLYMTMAALAVPITVLGMPHTGHVDFEVSKKQASGSAVSSTASSSWTSRRGGTWGTNPKPPNWYWPGYNGAWKTVQHHTDPAQDVASSSTAFSQQVKCNGTPIGTLDFLYRPYTLINVGSAHDHSGASMVGGFTASGNMPCGTDGYKENTKFKFIQLVKTNITGSPDLPNGNWFVDNPEAVNSTTEEPFYPYDLKSRKNPAGGNFNASYHDAAFGPEFAGVDRDWLAETMLVCTNGSKINLVGSFRYGYQTPKPQAGESTHDGIVRVNGTPAYGYVEPSEANQDEIDRLRNTIKGSQTRMGWTVSTGCCCPAAKPTESSSAANGNTEIEFYIPPNTTVHAIAIFPRNKQCNWTGDWNENGWSFESSLFWGVPLLPGQAVANEMYNEGVYLFPDEPLVGPMTVIYPLPLTGHESFLDVFMQGTAWEWTHWVIGTDHLLGDMNDDGIFNAIDKAWLQTAINNPGAYAAAFPWMNPIFAGDFGHDGTIDQDDVNQLDAHINHGVPDGDGVPEENCPADLDGDELIDVDDLIQLIGTWGFCEFGCMGDINDDLVVDIQDLLNLIDHWGSCSDEG